MGHRTFTETSNIQQDVEKMHSRGAREAGPAAGNLRLAEGSGMEMQPNVDAPLLRDDSARRKWLQQELTKCCEVLILRQ